MDTDRPVTADPLAVIKERAELTIAFEKQWLDAVGEEGVAPLVTDSAVMARDVLALVVRLEQAEAALDRLRAVAAQYLDTGRGDLDGVMASIPKEET